MLHVLFLYYTVLHGSVPVLHCVISSKLGLCLCSQCVFSAVFYYAQPRTLQCIKVRFWSGQLCIQRSSQQQGCRDTHLFKTCCDLLFVGCPVMLNCADISRYLVKTWYRKVLWHKHMAWLTRILQPQLESCEIPCPHPPCKLNHYLVYLNITLLAYRM